MIQSPNILDNWIIREKMKIMHLLRSNQFSGAENVACQICYKLDCENYNMVYVSPFGNIQQNLIEKKVKYIGLKKFNYANIKKVIKEFKPDVIHAHDVSASIIAALCKNKNIKIISHMHVNNNNMSKINFKTILYLLSSIRYNHIFWVSKSSYEGYIFKKSIKNKSSILVNIIDKSALQNKLQNSTINDKVDVVYLGRIQYQKNPEKLMDILKELKYLKNDYKAAIIGNGPLQDVIEKKIKEYELERNITVYGFLNNPYGILSNSKVMILTSRFEGTPMCALEAMALGIPIVSTPTDGMIELIENGKNGFLEENDTEFAKKINAIITDKKINSEFSNANIKKINDLIDSQKYYNTILECYNKK